MARGSALAIGNKVVSTAISFVSVPLILGYLGEERYGLWAVALSTLAFTSFLDIGLTPTIKNKMAEAFADKNQNIFRRYSSGGIFIGLAILLMGLLLSVGASFVNWATFLNTTGPLAMKEAEPLVTCVLFLLMSSLSLGMVDAIYVAKMQIGKTKVYSLASSILSFGLLLVGLHSEASLPILALITMGPGLAARCILLFALVRRDPQLLRFQWGSFVGLMKELIPSSILFMGIQFFAVVTSSLPNLLIAKYLSLEDVAVFSIAFKLITLPLFLVAEILPVFWPAFTIAWKRREVGWLRKRLTTITIATAMVLSMSGAVFSVFGQRGIELWTGGKITVRNDILLLLSVWLVVQGSVYWLSTFLHSIGDFGFELLTFGFTASLLLWLSTVLIGDFGLVGVVVSMLVSLIVASFAPMTWRVSVKLRG